MYKILKELLRELKLAKKDKTYIYNPINIKEKILALESVIEIIERLRNEKN